MTKHDELLALANELDDIADYPGSMKIASRVRSVAKALRAALAARPELPEFEHIGAIKASKGVFVPKEGWKPRYAGPVYRPRSWAAAGSAPPEEDTSVRVTQLTPDDIVSAQEAFDASERIRPVRLPNPDDKAAAGSATPEEDTDG
jgi:hypothetical protein